MLRVLGPVTAEADGRQVALGGPKERAVLAMLAVNRNHLVSVDALTAALWGDGPPRTATRTLHTYVSRLRKNLTGTGVTIDGVAPGYVLRVGLADLDADLAAHQAAEARDLAGTDPAAAAAALAQVLALWRGPALAEFAHEPFALTEVVRLDELRAAIEEDRLDALLASGTAPVAEAEHLAGEQPLRERRWALLMRALYRDGRQADALRAFQRARTALVDQLGLEPSVMLRQLEAAIVAQDPNIDAATDTATATATGSTVATGGGIETTTFLLTDIEGSTRQWERDADAMADLLAEHDRLIAQAVVAAGGQLIKTKGEGDSTFSVFPDPASAVIAALELQGQLALPVRMAIHHGEAEHRDGDWFGPTVNRVARLRGVGHGRQVLLSDVAADRTRAHLPSGACLRDLGAHRLKDLDAPERIWQLCAPELPAEFPPLMSRSAELTNLPAELSSFVGRQAELEQVVALAGESRLVTLTGPGGSGKTRLSVQAGARLLGAFTDGVWLVELAPVGPEQVAAAVAQALRVELPPAGDPLDAVIAAAGSLELLVLLDNCEHVVAAAAAAAERLLVACPRVRILASSRERLGVVGESTWPVLPLGLPEDDDDDSAEAVRLFVERARAAKPTFELTADNLPAVATICRRLDGIPLAIELAAARTRLLSPADIAQRLDDRFSLLTGGARTARPRQQTLRALVDWSYDLLDDDERRLFCELSVFRGGFTVAAAGAVHGTDAGDVFELVDRLAEKSLIVPGDGHRFTMLETLREYGLDQLDEENRNAVSATHSAWVRETVTALGAARGPGHADALSALRAEHDNVLAALGWCLSHDAVADAAAIVAGCWRSWHITGSIYEGSLWAGRVIDREPDAELDPVVLAEVLNGAAWLGYLSGTRSDASTLLRRSIDLAAETGAAALEAMAWAFLAEITRQLEGAPDVSTLLTRAIELADGCGATQEAGIARMFLSFTLFSPTARAEVLAKALVDAEAAGDRWLQGALAQLLARSTPDREEGDRLRALAMDAARDLLDYRNLAATLRQEAVVRVARGELDVARNTALEALALARAGGDLANRATHLWECGVVLEAVGDLEHARSLVEESIAAIPVGQEAADRPGAHVLAAYIGRGQGDTARALEHLRTAFDVGIGGPNFYALGIAVRLTATLAADAGDRGVAATLLAGLDAATERGQWSVLPEDLHNDDDRRRVAERIGGGPAEQSVAGPDADATLELAQRWVASRLAAG